MYGSVFVVVFDVVYLCCVMFLSVDVGSVGMLCVLLCGIVVVWCVEWVCVCWLVLFGGVEW